MILKNSRSYIIKKSATNAKKNSQWSQVAELNLRWKFGFERKNKFQQQLKSDSFDRTSSELIHYLSKAFKKLFRKSLWTAHQINNLKMDFKLNNVVSMWKVREMVDKATNLVMNYTETESKVIFFYHQLITFHPFKITRLVSISFKCLLI